MPEQVKQISPPAGLIQVKQLGMELQGPLLDVWQLFPTGGLPDGQLVQFVAVFEQVKQEESQAVH